MKLLEPWTYENKESYGRTLMRAKHNLLETGLFCDEALIKLLDTHPTDYIDVCTNDPDPLLYDRHVSVDFRGFSGADILDLVKRGKVYINLREAMNMHPDYEPIMASLIEELEQNSGIKENKKRCRGGILISSPTSITDYHSDTSRTNMWHLRGHKQIYVYPLTKKFLPDVAYERIIIGEYDSDESYHPSFDDDAVCNDLYGGEFLSWPHPAPHRVVNKSFCVSMVTEFTTRQTAYYNSIAMTNGLLRRHFNRNPVYIQNARLENLVKGSFGRIAGKVGARKMHMRKDFVKYALDPASELGVKPVSEPYERCY